MYYKRIEKKDYFYINAPIALQKSYETLKSKNGVIVSNDENGEFILVPTNLVDEFIITSVSREDILSQGYDPKDMTDEDMQDLASKMEEEYIEYGGFWDSLGALVNERWGCPLIENEEDEEDEE